MRGACGLLIVLMLAVPGWTQSRAEREVQEWVKILKAAKESEAKRRAVERIVELEAVRKGASKDAMPAIAGVLKDKDAGTRAAAARALGVLGYDAKSWAKDLGPLLNEKEREPRLAAVLSLGLVPKEAGFAVDKLKQLRQAEEAKPDDQRDNDMLTALRETLEEIQGSALAWGPWHYIGPFPNDGNEGFKTAFPPEKEIALDKTYPGKNNTTARWKKGDFTDGEVNSLALFEERNNSHAVVYLYREIECDADTEADVSLGSDDTLTVWCNGKQLLNEEVYRGAAADQNKATLSLRRGKNALLIKVCQGEGDWAFYFRVTAVRSSAR